MEDVFNDLSADALSRVSAAHYFDSFTCFSVIPDVEVYRGADMIRVVSPGIPNGLTNTVLRCRLSADNADASIDETNEYFSPEMWYRTGGSAPVIYRQILRIVWKEKVSL